MSAAEQADPGRTAKSRIDQIYVSPEDVDRKDCAFYHTIDVPGHGTLRGTWDLRANISRYLGGGAIDFRNKRVLDVGSANGFLSFYMEQQGAEVVALNLDPDEGTQEFTRHGGPDYTDFDQLLKKSNRGHQNAFWFARARLGSSVKLVRASVYDIPDEIGSFDVSVIGALLVHLKHPMDALEQVAERTTEAMIVTEQRHAIFKAAPNRPLAIYAGQADRPNVWWLLSPTLIARYLEGLGFPKSTTSYHKQKREDGPVKLFTVVARRD